MWLVDLALALLLAALAAGGTAAQGPQRGFRHVDLLAYSLATAGALVLAARRHRPTVIFALVVTAAAVYAARGYPTGPAGIAVFVAAYSLASAETWQRSLALALAAGVAFDTARLTFTSEPIGSAATNALGPLAVGLFLGWAVANRRAFVAEIRDRAERAERTREEEARRRVDAERLRIARELHDVVAHAISTINVQAGVGEHVIKGRPAEAARALAQIKATSKEALRELRAILDVLRAVDEPDSRTPAPGLAQIDTLISTVAEAGVPTALEIDGTPKPLAATVDLIAYRIIQESLTNVLRHAAPARATVRVIYYGEYVELSVSDDGSGANSEFNEGAGYGIKGIRERAIAVGGTLMAGPGPLRGFCVTAVLPVIPETHDERSPGVAPGLKQRSGCAFAVLRHGDPRSPVLDARDPGTTSPDS